MNQTILVVDDDRAMVRTLCDILRLRGWTAAAAHSGEEAVAAMRQAPCLWVLIDLKMPGMDGIEASKTIRDASPGARVILMSAHSTDKDLDRARSSGVIRFLPKPIDLPSLFEMLAA